MKGITLGVRGRPGIEINGPAADAVIMFFLALLNFVWFSFIRYRALMGDDLYFLNHMENYRSFFDAFTDAGGDKYRPVYYLINYFLFRVIGYNYGAYLIFNMTFNIAVIFILYKALACVSDDRGVAALFSAVFLISRFSYYNIMQQQGVMEASALLCFVLILYFTVRYVKEGKTWLIIAASVTGLVIPFIHERFIVVPLLLSMLAITVRKGPWQALAAVNLFPVLLNVFLKKAVFGMRFFMGTDGKAIDFSDAITMTKHFFRGAANMLGVNTGPFYLAGANIDRASMEVKIFSVMLFAAGLAVIILYFVNAARKKEIKPVSVPVFAAVSMLSMIMTASVSIRQEYRWLYAPFALFLVLLTAGMKGALNERHRPLFIFIFAALSFYNDVYYRGHLQDFYLTYAQKSADSLYSETIIKYGKALTAGRGVYIQDFRHREWITAGSLFFEAYAGKGAGEKVSYFESPEKLKIKDPGRSRVFVFDADKIAFSEIDPAALKAVK